MDQPSPEQAPTQWKFRLATQNPFYLISAACFIHSLSYAARGAAGGLSAGPRLALIGGYLLVVVGTSLVLVRKWKLWDDARSLLLIILLLFVEMDLAIDVLLVRNLQLGSLGAAGILLAIVVVSETVFRGLRLNFPARYRLPYYLLWGALTAYPIVCAVAASNLGERLTRWVIAGFLPLCSLLLLTLLPAARRGRDERMHAVHRWPWPLYPWSAFAFILLTLLFRQHALCVSFDPVGTLNAREAYALVSICGHWMAAPLLFAISLLILERAIASNWQNGQRIACLLPLCGVLLAFPGEGGNVIARAFVQDVTAMLGSPAWLAMLVCVAFQAIVWLRGARPGLPGLLIAVLLGAVIGPGSLGLATLTDPAPLWLMTAAALGGGVGFAHRSMPLLLFGGMSAIAAAWRLEWLNWGAVPSAALAAHLLLAWMLLVGIIPGVRDTALLRSWSALMLFVFAIVAMTQIESAHVALSYLSGLGAVAVGYGWAVGRESIVNEFTPPALVCLLYVATRSVWEAYAYVSRQLRWDGLVWVLLAGAAFAAGVGVSFQKARRRETEPTAQ
jgi:hypothetical protein